MGLAIFKMFKAATRIIMVLMLMPIDQLVNINGTLNPTFLRQIQFFFDVVINDRNDVLEIYSLMLNLDLSNFV